MKLDDIGFYTLSDDRVKNLSKTSPLQRCEMIVGDIFGEKLSWNNTRSSGFICVDKVLSGEEILGELKRLDASIRRDEDSLSLKNKTLKKLIEKNSIDKSWKIENKIKDTGQSIKMLEKRISQDMGLHNSILKETL